MTDQLPPLENDEEDGATVPSAPQRTQYTPSVPPRMPPPPGRSHVHPIPGDKRSARRSGPPRGTPPPGRARARRDSGLYLPLWSVALMLLLVLLLAFAVVFFVTGLGGGVPAESTPIIRIITAPPTLISGAGDQGVPEAIVSPTLPPDLLNQPPASIILEGPTLEAVIFTPTPISITLNSRVAVADVAPNELNVRDNPGTTDTTILFRALEGDVFLVIGGPNQASGLTWWQIQDPTNLTRTGWAASQFLRVIPDP